MEFKDLVAFVYIKGGLKGGEIEISAALTSGTDVQFDTWVMSTKDSESGKLCKKILRMVRSDPKFLFAKKGSNSSFTGFYIREDLLFDERYVEYRKLSKEEYGVYDIRFVTKQPHTQNGPFAHTLVSGPQSLRLCEPTTIRNFFEMFKMSSEKKEELASMIEVREIVK